MPTSFLPDEDQGMLFSIIQLPVGATQERTIKVLEQVEHHYLELHIASYSPPDRS